MIGVDNQAALSALKSVKSTLGQYIADEILEAAVRIQKQRNSPKYSLKFRWTAGHAGIEGNEEVDKEAKNAARGGLIRQENAPYAAMQTAEANKAALRQTKKGELKERWGSKLLRHGRDIHPMWVKSFTETLSNKGSEF